MTDEAQYRNRVAEQIIRAKGGLPMSVRDDRGNDAQRYEAFVVTEGFPMMGFSVFCANGKRHGFFYHNIDSLDLEEGKHGEYLRMTHRGKAVTLRGRGLHPLFQGIMDHTLQAVYEFSEALYPAPDRSAPVIERIRVDDISGIAKAD
jgi:hypothetical protein